MFPVIDTHCHIYPDKIALKAAKGIGSFYDIGMHYDGRLDTLKAVSARSHVVHSVIFSVATTPHQVHSINTFIAQNVRDGGGRFTGLGTLHPDSDTMEDDVKEIVSLGLKGVKLHPDVQQFPIDDPRGMRICELCDAYHLPLLIHTGDYRYDFSNVNRLIHLAVDSSSTFHWVSRDTAKKLFSLYGTDRVLFGSDFPMWDPNDEIEYLLSLGLSDDELAQVFYKNAQKMFEITL